MKTDLFVSLGIAAMTHVVALFAFNEENSTPPNDPGDDVVWITEFDPIPQIEDFEPEIIPDDVVDYTEADAGSSNSDLKSSIESGSASPVVGGPVLPVDDSRPTIKVPLGVSSINATPGMGSGSWAPTGLPGIESLDATPKVISQIPPRYPHEMRRSGIAGSVMVKLVVGPDGRVRAAEAVSFTHRSFADAATAAVKKWRFEPGKRQGRRVAFRVTVPVLFSVTD